MNKDKKTKTENDDQNADEVLKELQKMAEEKLSGFKKPKSYEFWEEELPRLPTGKIQRNLVKKRFW